MERYYQYYGDGLIFLLEVQDLKFKYLRILQVYNRNLYKISYLRAILGKPDGAFFLKSG